MKMQEIAAIAEKWDIPYNVRISRAVLIMGLTAMAVVFSILCIILPALGADRIERQPAALPSVGRPAPEFDLTLFNGQKVALKDFRGKAVVINFWSSG